MILDILNLPTTVLLYNTPLVLKRRFPDAAILETTDSQFVWQEYRSAGLCQCTPNAACTEQLITDWSEEDEQINTQVLNGFFDVAWNGQKFQLLQMSFLTPFGGLLSRTWIIAKSEKLTQDFFSTVCRWSNSLRDVVSVFQEGQWQKDADLFKAIQSSRFENLILPAEQKEAIRNDAHQFFASRDRYRQFNVAWKRGIILIGPPGNGKTHMIQALINDLQKPCLYVKSLKAGYHNEDQAIRIVFDKAREVAPCILVMEDLDSLIDDSNRSFCLNELDGFQKNDGLLVIATTNHPNKLDPAIVDRPSRFDRKYHFDLPTTGEREAYLRWWSGQLDAAMRLTDDHLSTIAEQTEGFSFAYLKELGLSTMIACFNHQDSSMGDTMLKQVAELRDQMSSGSGRKAKKRSKIKQAELSDV